MKVTTYQDHLTQLYEEFPDIDKRSIRSVVAHGLSMMSFFQLRGHDIYLNNNREKLYYYFGEVTNNEEKRKKISAKKHRYKIRLMAAITRKTYDGYFYFSLTEPQYQQHLAEGKVDKAVLYRLFAEAKLFYSAPHYFRVKMENPRKWFIVKENYETSSAEYFHEWDDKGLSSDINT